jgi:hypothetical protein
LAILALYRPYTGEARDHKKVPSQPFRRSAAYRCDADAGDSGAEERVGVQRSHGSGLRARLAAASCLVATYSDAKVANREIRVWHLVIENGY